MMAGGAEPEQLTHELERVLEPAATGTEAVEPAGD